MKSVTNNFKFIIPVVFFIVLISTLFFSATTAFSQSNTGGYDEVPTAFPGRDGGGRVGNDGGGKVDTSLNPGGITLFDPVEKSIEDIFRAILDIIMVFAIPIILFFIVWAGFLYVTAAGSQDKITQATKALTYAVIGGVIVLGANVLLAVITNTIEIFTK